MQTYNLIYCLLALAVLSVSACKSDPADQIPALEKYYAASGSQTTADSLLALYELAISEDPEKYADNLGYLAKAAEIEFLRNKRAVEAVRLVNKGLEKYSEGQDLTAPIGILTRVWRSYKYKATPDLSRNPDDIDLMEANLKKNMSWIDTNLVRLDQNLSGPEPDFEANVTPFIQIAEGYALLVEEDDENKHIELLMKAAGLAKTAGDPNTALRYYYNVAEKRQEHAKAPTALFMMAFIYENDLKDLDKAKETYELFLSRYPDDPDYVDDANNALKFLGMSPKRSSGNLNKMHNDPLPNP